MTAIGFERHDHAVCVSDLIARAEAHCSAAKLQFTPTRRRVLELLLEDHRAIGAYKILERLTQEGRGAQPPVAYRALDFLVTHGFAHKIERLNAYIACAYPQDRHAPAFMICRICDCVAESPIAPSRGPVGKAARDAGFRVERTVVEAEGICPLCIAAGYDA